MDIILNLLDSLFEFLKNSFFSVAGWAASFGLRLFFAVLALIIGLKCAKFFYGRIKNGNGMARLDKGLASFLCSLIKILLYASAIIISLLILGVPAASFVTAIASCGVAIGLAIQGSLANFAGGLMLLTFKPFQIGDYIEGAGYSGTVQDITILYTHIITPDNLKVTLPNGKLSDGAVVNYTATGTRRADISVRIPYEADITNVKALLKNIAENAPHRLKDQPIIVEITDYAESNIVMCLRYYVNTDKFWDSVFATRQTVLDTLKANGIEIPYNKIDVRK